MTINLSLFRHAFVLFLLALVGGLFIPAMAVPRLGLSAHTIGILSGTLLIAIGAIWQHFRLAARQAWLLKWSWLYSSYGNWFACMLGAVLGAGQMTPLATANLVGAVWTEGLVSALFISVGVSSFVAVGLSLWGLRVPGAVLAR